MLKDCRIDSVSLVYIVFTHHFHGGSRPLDPVTLKGLDIKFFNPRVFLTELLFGCKGASAFPQVLEHAVLVEEILACLG